MRAVSLLLCGVLGTALHGVEAQSTAASSDRLATKDEYVACLSAQDEIDSKRKGLSAQHTKLKEFETKFKAAEADLAAQVERHAPSNDREVASYNKAVDARNASAKKFNGAAESARKKQADLNELIAATNTRCGVLLVSPEVKQAAQEERRAKRGSQ